MIVKTIVNEADGCKWEIIKHEENRYSIDYYEYFQQLGWKKFEESKRYYTKDCIEWEFDIVVA